MFVINSNGNIENGDYITSSDYLGYGEKQDEIFLCNYTVAKATIDCNFELDSPYYNCCSALAAFHRALPVEQRDDEWHAVDAVLRARELHHYHRYQQQQY